ncbi:hypothetical protein E05_52030 (plasmid) [Plautia stali symbiont]|nr:hypothetical protein E05_52030 [Plautia stali symbiont]
MQLCKYAINSALDDFNSTALSSTPKMTDSSGTNGGNYTFRISNGSGICGTASIPEQQGSGSTSSGSFFNPFSSADTREVVDAQHSAMDAMKWSTKTGHRFRVFPVSVFRFVWG